MASVCSNVAANGGHDSGLSAEPARIKASAMLPLHTRWKICSLWLRRHKHSCLEGASKCWDALDPSENWQCGDVSVYFCDVSP